MGQYRSNNNLSADAICQHFENIHVEYTNDFPLYGKFLEQHLFFTTVSFDLQKVTNFRSKAPTQLTEFGRLHFKISRYLLGNNLNRKRRHQPLTYAFVDFEGSRLGQSDAIHSELPHIHALTLVAPKYLAKFRSAIFEPRLRSWVGSINGIQIKNFSEDEGTIENLVSYCMKGHNQTAPSHFEREDLWSIFPR
jgi:hypothetical protein